MISNESTGREDSGRATSCQLYLGRGGTYLMHESTLALTPFPRTSRPRTDDVSLIRAALFGAIVPPFLATFAFLLLRAGEWSPLPFPFFLLFMFIQLSLFLSIFCVPFGVASAVLCGVLARVWLRRGSSLADVRARLSSVGAMCGLVALWGVGALFNGGTVNPFMSSTWPPSFWGAALMVGAICGWLLPRAARISRHTTAVRYGER